MPISTLTAEKVAKLMQEHERKAITTNIDENRYEAQELKALQKKKPEDLWFEASKQAFLSLLRGSEGLGTGTR